MKRNFFTKREFGLTAITLGHNVLWYRYGPIAAIVAALWWAVMLFADIVYGKEFTGVIPWVIDIAILVAFIIAWPKVYSGKACIVWCLMLGILAVALGSIYYAEYKLAPCNDIQCAAQRAHDAYEERLNAIVESATGSVSDEELKRLSDKINNANAVLCDYAQQSEEVWKSWGIAEDRITDARNEQLQLCLEWQAYLDETR